MHRLTIAENLIDPSSWFDIQTDDVCASLMQRYATFPRNARLYCGQPTQQNDVTPKDEADCEAISKMEGDFHLIVYPQGIEILSYVAYALIAVVAIVAITTRPKIPNTTTRNYQSQSPNNALSGRTNQARVNNRIPDIYGTVRSTPDLIAVPYSIFKDHIEFEYCYMCVGRGQYDIQEQDVKDGQTQVSKIFGESVEIYNPFNSPNKPLSVPFLSIGDAIDRKVISAVRSKSVNGQTLLAPNESDDTRNFNNLVSFQYPNKIVAISSNPVTFNDSYSVGDNISVLTSDVGAGGDVGEGYPVGPNDVIFRIAGTVEFVNGLPPGTIGSYLQLSEAVVGPLDFSGKYIIQSVAGNVITLLAPEESSSAWSDFNFTSLYSGETPVTTIQVPNLIGGITLNFTGVYEVLSVSDKVLELFTPSNKLANNNWVWLQGPGLNFNGGDESWGFDGSTVTIGTVSGDDNWIGPFVLDASTMTEIIANYVALNGMYRDNGVKQERVDVDLQLGVTPCDAFGNATGVEQYFGVTVEGSSATQSTRAATLFADLPLSSRYMVRTRRLTGKDLAYTGTVVDEVKWRDVYASSPVGDIDFGNITTVHAVTQATQQALAVSERQLNMLVTRLLPLHIDGAEFSEDLVPTRNAADIISYICLDPKLGNRSPAEVNFDNIYEIIASVVAYFANPSAAEFCYTFDNDNLSFEEMINTVAQAVFCRAQRRGRVIELSFEKETEDSALLFNHRNKVPGSETRTTTFGQQNGYDGVEYQYVSDVDDALVTYYIPEDKSAVNPKKFESVGVRSEDQAYLHAYREYNRLLYQTRSTEFTALQEAEVLSLNTRILVADNTRPDVQDGEVVEQVGLLIKLSQPAIILKDAFYVIYLQHISGVVEAISIVSSPDPYHVVLGGAPMDDLIIDNAAAVKTLYQIVKDTDTDNRSFLLTEKNPQSNFLYDLVAINYDPRYYQNDHDRGSLIGLGWASSINLQPPTSTDVFHGNTGSGNFGESLGSIVYFGIEAYAGQSYDLVFTWTPLFAGPAPDQTDMGNGYGFLQLDFDTIGTMLITGTINGGPLEGIFMTIGMGDYNPVTWGPI